MSRSGIFGSNSSSGGMYSGTLTAEQKQKWDRQFDVADTNGDGSIDAGEGQVFFMKSGLSTDVLHKIWSMAGTLAPLPAPVPPAPRYQHQHQHQKKKTTTTTKNGLRSGDRLTDRCVRALRLQTRAARGTCRATTSTRPCSSSPRRRKSARSRRRLTSTSSRPSRRDSTSSGSSSRTRRVPAR